MAFLTRDELLKLGFPFLGENVLISEKASLYGCERISIGSNVRIDDFCILSAGAGGINIGNHVHIAVFCSIMGAGKITMCDYSGLSSRVSIYSSNDDYTGRHMTNPTIPIQFTNVTHADVYISKHVIIGSASIILPGVTFGEGAAVGALSLVKKDCDPFTIYSGNPAIKVMNRRKGLLDCESRLLEITKSKQFI